MILSFGTKQSISISFRMPWKCSIQSMKWLTDLSWKFLWIQNVFRLIDACHKMMQNLQCKSFYANNFAVGMPNFKFKYKFQKGYLWDLCVIQHIWIRQSLVLIITSIINKVNKYTSKIVTYKNVWPFVNN